MSSVIRRSAPRAALSLCLALTALLIAHPVRALAGQIVYSAGTGIWAMNDDGTAKHELVDVTQVPGTELLSNPDVQPGGTEVAFSGRWNQASAEQNKFIPASPGFCGGNCEGYYELRNGSVTRISPAPFDCGAQPCASYEAGPRVASDGSVAYVFQQWVSELSGYGGWDPILGESALLSRDSNGNNQQQWQTGCEDTSSASAQITDANLLAVDPVNPNEIAYANCAESSTANCDLGYVTGYDVDLSGANRGDAADDVRVHTVSDPNARCLQDAGTQVADLGFSPDGSNLVEMHGGSGAGIYTYPARANATATELMAITGDWVIYAARYVGSNRIGFTAGEDTNGDGMAEHIDLYTIPTSCTPQTCALATGQGITNLSRSGDLTFDYILNTAGFGYTSSTAPLTAVPAGTGPGAGGPGGTGTGGSAGTGSGTGKSGTGPGPGTTGTGTSGPGTAPQATISVSRTLRLTALLHQGVTFKLSCTSACRTSAALVLDGATARRLHLETGGKHAKPRSLVVGSASRRLTQAGAGKLTVHLSSKAASKLRHAKAVTLQLSVTVAGGRTVTKTIHVSR